MFPVILFFIYVRVLVVPVVPQPLTPYPFTQSEPLIV